jgi:hypothetical protein
MPIGYRLRAKALEADKDPRQRFYGERDLISSADAPLPQISS